MLGKALLCCFCWSVQGFLSCPETSSSTGTSSKTPTTAHFPSLPATATNSLGRRKRSIHNTFLLAEKVGSSPDCFSEIPSALPPLLSPLELELEELQQRYSWIEALEERNNAQLQSFIDQQHQWDSLEPDEQLLLTSKPQIEARMQELAVELVQLWMGQKSMDG